MSIIKQLRKAFPEFKFEYNKSTGSYFGSLATDSVSRKLNKHTYTYGTVYIYVSGEMYPGENRNFVYAMCYQKSQIKRYRCHTSHEIETGKVFVSGKTVKDAVDNLIKEVDMNAYYLSK